jgi:hypothetical protein
MSQEALGERLGMLPVHEMSARDLLDDVFAFEHPGRAPIVRGRAWADSLPEHRLHGVIAGKLYTYARDARAFAAGRTESRSQKGTPA